MREPATVPTRVMPSPRLVKLPKNRILASDVLRGQGFTSHKGRGVRPSWNLLFADGHVSNLVSKAVWDRMGAYGDFERPSPAYSTGQKWNIVENHRDMLESIEEGRDPLTSSSVGYGTADVCRIEHKAGETNGGTRR